MLILGFIGLGVLVIGFLGGLLNMFFMIRTRNIGGFSLHILSMALIFIGMVCMIIGFAPSIWNLLLTLIDHAKK